MKTIKRTFAVVLLILVALGLYHYLKPLPRGLNFDGEVHSLAVEDVHFFRDLTYVDTNGNRQVEQQIFDELLRMLDEATTFIYVDMFFYSDFNGSEPTAYRELSRELTKKLIEKKQTHPEIRIQVVSDPINVMYGGHVSNDFEALRASGIDVVITNLGALRDSNPIYSTLWRAFIQPFGNSSDEGYLPNPVDADSPKLGLRSYFQLANFKANHRKVAMTDFQATEGPGISTLITSANPNDGSAVHSNVAIRVDRLLWQDVWQSEAAVVEMSGGQMIQAPIPETGLSSSRPDASLKVQLFTERAIEYAMLTGIDALSAGDDLNISMFTIADRHIVKALLRADARGVRIRLLLDPSKGAFGQEGNGMPNRQVANELVSNSSGNIQVRWCNTQGEQCHSKLLVLRSNQMTTAFFGSANLTKRNLGNYNLESNVAIKGNSDVKIFQEITQFFQRQWENETDRTYSVPFSDFQNESRLQTVLYRVQEFSGLSRW